MGCEPDCTRDTLIRSLRSLSYGQPISVAGVSLGERGARGHDVEVGAQRPSFSTWRPPRDRGPNFALGLAYGGRRCA
jgi:hypothetical protein